MRKSQKKKYLSSNTYSQKPAFFLHISKNLVKSTYSKLSIIRPGRSRLLEFEKKDSNGRLIETFSKYPDQVV